MVKQQFKDSIINKIIFRTKITDKKTIAAMKSVPFTDLMLFYINTIPTPKTLQECHNQLVLLRKYALDLLNQENEIRRKLSQHKNRYNQFIKSIDAKTIDDLTGENVYVYEYFVKDLEHLENVHKITEDMIINANAKLEMICEIYDRENLSLHDFCQLVGINYQTAKLNIDNEDEVNHYHYIFHGIEDSRENEYYKDNRNGMPLFNLVHEHFMILMRRNKAVKNQVDNFIMHDLGFAEHMLTIKEDADGNKTVEKYYPPLKAIK